MFKPQTAETIDDYFGQISEPRKSEIIYLHKLIKTTLPHLDIKIYHNIIGYGSYHFESKSGRTGDWFVVGLASQKNYISVYLCATDDGEYIAEKNKSKLPKASIGKSCIRFKKLSDIDQKILKDLIIKTDKIMKEKNYEEIFDN